MSAYPVAFDHARFAAVPPMVAATTPPKTSKLSAYAPIEIRGALMLPKSSDAVARGVWIQEIGSPGNKSQSFQNESPDRNAPVDPVKHFNFLPGIDTVEIRWEVTDIDSVTKALFEIWSAADDTAAIWTKEYKDGAAVSLLKGPDVLGSGPLAWSTVDVAGDAVRFPDSAPNAAFAPYQLRLTITSKSGAVTTAWTYFDILVDSIELHWGPEAWIPAAQIPQTSAMLWPSTQADEKTLLKRLKGQRLTTDPEVTAIATAGVIPVRLPSTMGSYVTCYEWYGHGHDFAYLRHRAKWGKGPRIPVVATIYLRRMDGSKLVPGVGNVATWDQAGAALGPARFLWDWDDRTLADRTIDENQLNPDAGAYVIDALQYKENTGDEPPDCLNCHVERGGKRGSTDRIFIPGTGAFPFTLGACVTRKWGTLTTAVTSGAHACKTGVIFNPSRLAKDTYRITVLLASELSPDRTKPAVDAAGKIDPLLGASPGIPHARTGMIEIIRQINARYIRKGNYAAIDLTLIDRSYAAAGLYIEWLNNIDPNFTGLWTQVEYNQFLQDALAKAGLNYSDQEVMGRRYNRAGSFPHQTKTYAKIDKAIRMNVLDKYDHWFGCPAGQVRAQPSEVCVTLPDRSAVLALMSDQPIQTYINKKRKINDKKKKWRKLKAANPTVSDVELRQTFYSTILKTTEKTKVDVGTDLAYTNAGWKHRTENNPQLWAGSNYEHASSGLLELVYEMHHLKIMADAYVGVTFFHYINMFETLDTTGAPSARYYNLGGVAKAEVSVDMGLKCLFFVWDHPTDNRRAAGMGKQRMMNGNVTAVHEFGHSLHLAHAFGGESIWMHDGNPPMRPDDLTQHTGGLSRQCVMNYHLEDPELCGVCRLRLRGWAFLRVAPLVGFDSTDPTNQGQVPVTDRFATLNIFFTDIM